MSIDYDNDIKCDYRIVDDDQRKEEDIDAVRFHETYKS